MAKERKLTAKQALFVKEYLLDLNATQAAVRAGYSKKNAARIAVELLNKTHVASAVQKAITKRNERTEISQDRILEELAHIAFGNLGDVVEWGPAGVKLKDSKLLTPEQLATICEVSETVTVGGGSMRIKRHDKMKALELLGRHLGLFDKKDDGLDKLKGVLEHMEGLGSTLQNPQSQRNIKDFE